MGRADEEIFGGPAEVGWYVRLLPVVVLVGGLVVDFLTPTQYTSASFYSVAPVLAAPLLSMQGTMVVGLAAIVADAAILAHFGRLRGLSGMSELLTVSLVAVVAVFINRLLEAREDRLRSARSITAAVQRAVLPEPPARVRDLRIAARYEAAEAEAEIGGDLYAVQDTSYGLRCIVGDVRGKGLDAVEAATLVLGSFRMAADEQATLADVAGHMLRALWRELSRREEGEQLEWFATAVLVEFPHGGDHVRLVNLGHPAPLLLRRGKVRAAEPSRYGLLLVEGLGKGEAVVDTVPFPPGSTLLLCTDGVTDARDAKGRFYDPQARLAGVERGGPAELLEALLDDVHRHAGGPTDDDMALLAVTRDS
ncbi:PP2C family protein-serine/threonine phosphatase [Streptomyces sp. PA03-1a]|nr:PP2C family protein-serine/threonine phosphatase [Streptomyces sp. PA03-1a]MDX2818897.1 PP2C family protein-serine/threonine phosphatase [Streptomyces sp. PA03-5A]